MTMHDTNNVDVQLINLYQKILDNGVSSDDRTGEGTYSIWGHELRFDLSKGFPVASNKRVYYITAFKEMLWMLSGSDSLRPLLENNVHIWTEWPHKDYVKQLPEGHPDKTISLEAFEQRILDDDKFAEQYGSLNRVYGKQWREWQGLNGEVIDQVSNVIRLIHDEPYSRRIIIEGWNCTDLEKMALPPCHKTYQFRVNQQTGALDSFLYQRSCDSFLGLAFFCDYEDAFLTTLIAHQTDRPVGEMVWYGTDVHIYKNHVEQVKEMMSREVKAMPQLKIKRKASSLFGYDISDFELIGYEPHPAIEAPVAV